KTAIPYRAEAKISMRLVPNQDPDKIVKLAKHFIKERNADVQVIAEPVLRPYLGPRTGPYADAARAAMRNAFGKEPAFVREGGSIGAVVTMEKYLKAPIVFLGLSLPEHGYHAPNENFDWEQASGGMRIVAEYFETLARLPSRAPRGLLLNQFRQLTHFGGLLQVGRETGRNGLLDVRVRAGSGERNCRNRSEALDAANTPNELQA